MIVRNGSRTIDYGPTPAPTHARGSVAGHIVVSLSEAASRRALEKARNARYRAKLAAEADAE